MKKLLTFIATMLLNIVAYAQVDETFQFVDADGNVVTDGTVITVSEVDPESGMMVVPLSVRNVSGQKAAVSMFENIDNKPNGDWQTCAFGNCMILNETGYSPKNIVAADYNASIQTEWIPVEEEYATWEATLQIHVFNIVTKSSFGQLIEQPGDEVIGYGPKVTVRFEYKDPAQQEKAKVWWGYVGENDAVNGMGTQKIETYHCASFYAGNNEVAAGKTIQAVRFNLLSSNVKNVKVWIAASLPTTVDEANVIELVEVKSPVTGVNEVTLPTPYTIGANGVFVGYTFTITKVANQDDAYPIPVSGSDLADALWLRTSSSVNSWTNMYGQGYGCLYLRLLLEGEFPYANAASVALANIGESVAVISGTAPAYLPVTNMGTDPILSIDYTVTSYGVTGAEQHVDVASPIGFGNTQVLTITVNADEEAGTKNKTLTITKVNGVANESGEEQTQFTVATVSRLADHVIAVEENTGTGCGWCPRGMVGMEKIRKAFGDKAVGIAIHRYNSTDAMYISAYSQVSFNNSAPACRVNRGEIIDPYYGSNGNILDDVDYALSIPAKAAISVTGEWSEDGKKVNATATIESLMPGQNYKIEYVLVADGLSGTGSAWTQQNYYATNYTATQLPSDLADFGSGGKLGNSSLTGLTFNDVAIAVGKSTQTTAPGTLALGEQVTNTYTLSLPTKTTLLNAIQIDKVYVVALLINSDGTIANAAKYKITKESVIENVAIPQISRKDNEITITTVTDNATIYYTLDGTSPTKSSLKYVNPITMANNCTIKAFAVADGYKDSEVATYVVDWFKVENVSVIFENKLVQMSTLTPDARIYYTIDGSTPTEKSIRYTEPFMVATSCTVKAIAYKDNFNPSEVTSKDIDVSVFTCAAPMFQRDGNSVSIVCSTAGASIYYTQDGSNPNTNSTPYTEPIQLVHNGTLKAIAVKENYYDSQVVTYTVNWFQVESVAIIFENKLVQISTPTPDARIYYTMDGTTPTAQSLQYTNPFEVTANCTIKAIAYKDNFNPSEVVSKYIDISVITCADPSFQRDGNSVSIVCSTAGASIYYTLDGSNPTTGSTPYTAPIQLGQNGTLKAIAVKENYYDSQVVTYSVNWFQVESVAITYENKLIQMSTPTPDARIYYTMDGTTPTAQSLQYTNPFVVTANCTIKAIAYKDNFNPSEVTSKYIDVSLFICAAPTFQREGNTVSIMSSTDGATIYYTTDGSEPTVNSTKYSTPITLTQNGMLKALAAKENYDNSQVASYTVDWFQVEKVVISNEGNRIQLSSPTPDARIYYTLDGSTPTDQSVRYTEPFTLAANCTVKAVAYKDNFNPSEVSSKDIDVSVFTCAAPMFQRDGNTVTLVSSTEGATIYYTQDGSQPRTSSTIYSAPITFTHNAIIKAIAVKQNYINSDVATYYIDWFKVEEVAISNEGKRITMSTPTADAHIYYTLDGSTPTENSVRYTEPFMVPTACTIQAMAIKENFNSSNVTSKKIEAEMIICAVPSFQRDGNKVAIACLTEGAVVYYTLDGSEPTKGSNVYTNPVTLTQNGVLKAVAVKDYYDNSQTASYTVDWFKVEAVTITFLNLKVTLSTATPNARIYYTLDGSTPTENSMRYSEPFGVAANCMVNAVAFKENFNPSDLTSLYIDLENVRCDLPTFQQTDKELAIITQTEGATVYYTLDGSEPKIESNRYDGSITLTRNGTVKAIAVKDGYLNSRVATYEVTSFQVAMPSFAVDGSVLTITCGTEEAAIYYIIGEGNLEITEQNKYTGPITLTENNIVRAIGVKEGYRNSEVATYNHNSETCHDVAINYNGRYVTLSTTTDGASIYYTTDGSNPTAESQQYNGNAIVIDALCRVNAVATKQNLNNSNVASLEIAYVYDGQAVVVRNAGLLSRAFEWHQGTAESDRLIVKGTLNASDLDFIKTLATVKYLDMKDVTIEGERLPDEAFAYTNLISIELPVRLSRTGKNLFEGCNSLAAIIWNANTLLTEEAMMGFSNPNLLVYVNSLSLAPVANNVVSMANNKAANIVLEDVETGNGSFYCPRSFKADQISYRRNFTLESGKQASGGWETIALPFNVASVTHEQHGLLAPFGSTVVGAKPFWLYSLQSTGFNPAVEIVANTPYIICMPNHADYADEYNQNGYVTFSATNAEIPVTTTAASVQETSNSSISLIPTFSHIAKTSGIYAINREVFRTYSPGSIFVDNLRDVHPFEAYSTIDMNSAGSRVPLYILIGERMATAIQDITSHKTGTAKVFNLNGQRVQSPGKGLYIVGGKKIVMK